MTQTKQVIGRFAPSPSGPLHFGSLVAAIGSYLIAKSTGGKWLVRIEDIDPPREVAGAADVILRQLEAFGFEWDGEVLYQSTRLERYAEVLNDLKQQDLVYACDCTRKQIFAQREDRIYTNVCADKNLAANENSDVAWRMRHGSGKYSFNDHIQGHCQFDQSIYDEDFIIKRKDGLIAYQLAVVVDDIDQGINQVVRGLDILDSTPRQLRLYEALGATPPEYYHLPLALDKNGDKLCKQHGAKAIESENASELLVRALEFLSYPTTPDLKYLSPQDILSNSKLRI
ncbi:tRNA glutamyl-Q(34) synthetase GluQRS [Kangiella sp. HZ709]|uniref:tRNA glutamyl-Q(34) synthetase GluQRS n=1 Tax=Kangiella sp. HZ709 TaxID=2666328 RepID=UPI0012B0B93D|nr:tRNA glutamyl-Q(34) synthetase GluQRS [Kangiella sp. HZ709]MRX27689.1 tRNA glutamyl-Q(34) synthetase GluQRS [Kangiella sp. HZ709]